MSCLGIARKEMGKDDVRFQHCGVLDILVVETTYYHGVDRCEVHRLCMHLVSCWLWNTILVFKRMGSDSRTAFLKSIELYFVGSYACGIRVRNLTPKIL